MKRWFLLLLLVVAGYCAQAQSYWDAYAPQRVFTPDEQPAITVSGVGAHRLQVRVYQVDEGKVVRHHLNQVSPLALRGKPVGAPQTALLQPPVRQAYYAREVRLPRLPVGMYVVVTTDQRGSARANLLWISDVGLVVKYAPTGNVLARVVRLRDGRGVAGAKVALYVKGNSPLGQATTDADGVALLPPCPAGSAMVWAFWGAHRAATYLSCGDTSPFIHYLFTDRPVYRPGQKVYFKGIVREQEGNEYRLPAVQEARVSLLNPENQQVAEQTVPVSERGTFAGEFSLPEEAPLGGYSFRVAYLRTGQLEPVTVAEYAGGFEVQEYRKPEFRVKLEPAQKVYLRGETVTFRLQAEYYFGAPVVGAQVRYYLYRRYLWSGWEEEDEYRELYPDEELGEEVYGGYGELLAQGETTTDARGNALIHLPARAHAEPCSYALEVEVTDLSLRTEETAASVDVYPAAIRLDWRPENWWLEPGRTGSFPLRALHPRTGQPLRTAVRVAAYRVRWTRIGREQWKREEIPLWSRTVSTNAQGIALVELTPPREGEYLLRASATDAQGRTTQAELFVGAYTPVYRGELLGARQTLELSLDRRHYLPGERAKVLIRSSLPDAEVWFTVEGRQVFSSRVVRLRNGVGVVELPTEWRLAPNAFVCASIVYGKTLIRVQKLLRVAPKGKLLQVEVLPDKERYLPNEEAVYTIRTRDDEGRPVSAEVALGVVDEAIYAILPDTTPDIRRFFWGATPNAVSTAISFGREYAAGAAKETRAQQMDEEIRRRFEDTAFWSPFILTDNNGEAQVRFPMPENLTQWRATARAITADTAVGMVRRYTRTFKPLLVRLQTPRFLTQGDRSVIAGAVHNYTEKTQQVQVVLQVNGSARIVQGQSRQLSLPPQGQAVVEWTVEADAAGEAAFTLTARSPEQFDGMEVRVPVYARGVPRLFASASLVERAVEKSFHIARTRVPGSLKAQVRVAPSWFGAAIGALDEILVYPYGCVEQTVHPMLSALRVLEVLEALGMQDAARRQRAQEAVRRGIARLGALQRGDGSWGYTEYASEDVLWTALAVEALHQAKEAGFAVSAERLQRGVNALFRLIAFIPSQPPRLQGMPKARQEMSIALWIHQLNEKAHALATAARLSPRWAQKPLLRLMEVRGYLGTSSQCALAMALQQVGLSAQARQLYQEILARAIQTPTTAFWREQSPQMLRPTEWLWYAQDTYATAWVARLLVRNDPRHPLLPKALRWLAEKRRGEYWHSTNDTAQVILALTEYAQRMPQAARGEHRVRILLNGEAIRELQYRAEDWLRPEEVVEIPPARLRDGVNTLRIEHEGEGAVAASMMIRHFEPTERVQATAQQLRVERIYLKRVPRQISPAERRRLLLRYGDESEYLWDLQPARGVFRPGEQLLVKLVVHCATDIYYGVIDAPKPSGFEFVERPADRYDWIYWYARREVRDDRVAFLATRIPKGKSVITYVLRAERPGQVRARPVQAFGMYLPEVNGNSGENVVRVGR
ncbi:MAG: alpha-2-macroglobulin family protein [Armatimonadota bacterium]|nr:alpha-2-macroglobulin family protein [Armatimonadota bacterium]